MCPIQALLRPFSLAGQASCNYLLAPLDYCFFWFWGQVSVSMNQQVRDAHTHRGNLNHCLKKLVTLWKRPWRNQLPSNGMATCP